MTQPPAQDSAESEPKQPPANRPDDIDEEVCLHVESCDELALYLFARSIADTMSRLGREMAPLQVKHRDVDFTEGNDTMLRLRSILRYTAEQTTRFGVEKPLEEKPSQILGGKPIIKPSDDYTRWFMWWHTYISDLPEEWWDKVRIRIEAGEDTSDVRPAGQWQAPEGVVPKKWLTFEVDPLDAVYEIYEIPHDSPKMAALVRFMKPSDSLWHFQNPDGLEEGLVVVSLGRPLAMVLFSDIKPQPEEPK